MTCLLIVCPADAMCVGVGGYSWHKFNGGSIEQTAFRLARASLPEGAGAIEPDPRAGP